MPALQIPPSTLITREEGTEAPACSAGDERVLPDTPSRSLAGPTSPVQRLGRWVTEGSKLIWPDGLFPELGVHKALSWTKWPRTASVWRRKEGETSHSLTYHREGRAGVL